MRTNIQRLVSALRIDWLSMAQGKCKAPQDILSELGVDDLYNFIGVEFQATDKEVQIADCCYLFL